MIYVQFKDDRKLELIAVFSSPQPNEYYPNQAEIEEDDSRYQSFVARYEPNR